MQNLQIMLLAATSFQFSLRTVFILGVPVHDCRFLHRCGFVFLFALLGVTRAKDCVWLFVVPGIVVLFTAVIP
jgi:hypothetical protein